MERALDERCYVQTLPPGRRVSGALPVRRAPAGWAGSVRSGRHGPSGRARGFEMRAGDPPADSEPTAF